MFNCSNCNSDVKYMENTSSLFHGVSRGPMWVCTCCSARVGCHKDGTPMGTTANRYERFMRIKAHKSFDLLWSQASKRNKSNAFEERSKAYSWLAECLQIDVEHCHIGMFDAKRCEEVIRICKNARH